jgi:hypothetical protein
MTLLLIVTTITWIDSRETLAIFQTLFQVRLAEILGNNQTAAYRQADQQRNKTTHAYIDEK